MKLLKAWRKKIKKLLQLMKLIKLWKILIMVMMLMQIQFKRFRRWLPKKLKRLRIVQTMLSENLLFNKNLKREELLTWSLMLFQKVLQFRKKRMIIDLELNLMLAAEPLPHLPELIQQEMLSQVEFNKLKIKLQN